MMADVGATDHGRTPDFPAALPQISTCLSSRKVAVRALPADHRARNSGAFYKRTRASIAGRVQLPHTIAGSRSIHRAQIHCATSSRTEMIAG